MNKIEDVKYTEGVEVMIFKINDQEITMSKSDYQDHLDHGHNNPVLIGDKLYMVSDKEFSILKDIENKLSDMGFDKLPEEVKKLKANLKKKFPKKGKTKRK